MTSPDTSTLNGALEQLGITMAENLVTMGVSDADPSDGLTTLANKILDIAPTPPTPTPASIDLTSNKSILSYADSESASLTATVYDSSDNPLSGQTVSMKVYKTSDDSLLETLTVTDVGNGTYTASYLGQGAGDLYIKAECMSLIQTYAVQDCSKYISTSTTANAPSQSKFNNVADFGVYDGTDMYYSIILSSSRFSSEVVGCALSNNVQTSAIAPYPSGYCDYRLFGDTSNKGFGGGCQSGGDYGMHTTSGALSTDTEYLFEMELHNNSMTGKITKVSDNTVVYNQTITPPKDFSNWHFCLFLFNSISAIPQITYKEVKVKPL